MFRVDRRAQAPLADEPAAAGDQESFGRGMHRANDTGFTLAANGLQHRSQNRSGILAALSSIFSLSDPPSTDEFGTARAKVRPDFP